MRKAWDRGGWARSLAAEREACAPAVACLGYAVACSAAGLRASGGGGMPCACRCACCPRNPPEAGTCRTAGQSKGVKHAGGCKRRKGVAGRCAAVLAAAPPGSRGSRCERSPVSHRRHINTPYLLAEAEVLATPHDAGHDAVVGADLVPLHGSSTAGRGSLSSFDPRSSQAGGVQAAPGRVRAAAWWGPGLPIRWWRAGSRSPLASAGGGWATSRPVCCAAPHSAQDHQYHRDHQDQPTW